MIRRFFMSLLLATMCLTASPPLAGAAFNPFKGCEGVSKSGEAVACNTDKDQTASEGPKALMLRVTNIIAFLAGAFAVIIIIVGGIRFITAGSDISTGSRTDTDVEDARRSIVGALIGLAVIILAKVLITFAIRRF